MTAPASCSFPLDGGGMLEIREADVSDAEALVEYASRVGGESDFLTFGANEFWISVPEEEKFIAEVRKKGQDVFLMGALEGVVVSTLTLVRTDRPRLRHIAVLGVSVSRSHWGRGIARRMCLFAIGLAKSRGVTKVNLKVRVDNLRAIRLYERLGFKREGVSTRAFLVGGTYHSEQLMGLEL